MHLTAPANLCRRYGLRPYEVRRVLLSGRVPVVVVRAVTLALDVAFAAAARATPSPAPYLGGVRW